MAIRIYMMKFRVWAVLGDRMVGKIIALKPLGNMTKMPDLGVNSFLRSHEAKIFVNLAEKCPGYKGLMIKHT